MRFQRGRPTPPAAVVGAKGKGAPSVTLKLAMDRNGAVDDMAEGPKRFTSQESLDAGEKEMFMMTGLTNRQERVGDSVRRSFSQPRLFLRQNTFELVLQAPLIATEYAV